MPSACAPFFSFFFPSSAPGAREAGIATATATKGTAATAIKGTATATATKGTATATKGTANHPCSEITMP